MSSINKVQNMMRFILKKTSFSPSLCFVEPNTILNVVAQTLLCMYGIDCRGIGKLNKYIRHYLILRVIIETKGNGKNNFLVEHRFFFHNDLLQIVV